VSQADATAFLDRVETDEEFAKELESVSDDPPAVLNKMRAEGFEVEPEEVRTAFLDRYGTELTSEQMDQIAAGVTTEQGILIGIGVAGAAMSAALF
jgi:predicted ribosomally synthesized peptide with nif11-like leader